MRLSAADQAAARRALCALAHDHRRFQDLLWLEFGDAWTDVRAALVKAGYVRFAGEGHPPRLTTQGAERVRQFEADRDSSIPLSA